MSWVSHVIECYSAIKRTNCRYTEQHGRLSNQSVRQAKRQLRWLHTLGFHEHHALGKTKLETENGSVVARASGGGVCWRPKGMREIWGLVDVFQVLFVVMVIHLPKLREPHSQNWWIFILHKIYLNKPDLKKIFLLTTERKGEGRGR